MQKLLRIRAYVENEAITWQQFSKHFAGCVVLAMQPVLCKNLRFGHGNA